MKNACKKLESSVDSAVPCKIHNLGHGETGGTDESNIRRLKYTCIVEGHESTRKLLERTLFEDHEDRFAGGSSVAVVLEALDVTCIVTSDTSSAYSLLLGIYKNTRFH